MNAVERAAFLNGYKDALDDMPGPSTPNKTDAEQKAWEAGQAHFANIVNAELNRLKTGVVTGIGFPA